MRATTPNELIVLRWQAAFWQQLRTDDRQELLTTTLQRGSLGAWTAILTETVIDTCGDMGWLAAGKGHPLQLLPESRHEYLGLDVVAFPNQGGPWSFPIAAFELENNTREQRIAYSLWKLLCVRLALRLLFCYSSRPEGIAGIINRLEEWVVRPLPPAERSALTGETAVVVGSRAEASTFPYGYFHWWKLDYNTGRLHKF